MNAFNQKYANAMCGGRERKENQPNKLFWLISRWGKEKLQHIHINHFSLSCEKQKLYVWGVECELWIQYTWLTHSILSYTWLPSVTFNGRTLRSNFVMIQTNCQHFSKLCCYHASILFKLHKFLQWSIQWTEYFWNSASDAFWIWVDFTSYFSWSSKLKKKEQISNSACASEDCLITLLEMA